MPKKKTLPATEPMTDAEDVVNSTHSPEPEESKTDTQLPVDTRSQNEIVPEPASTGKPENIFCRPWVMISSAIVGGMLFGFLISYTLFIKPLQDQMIVTSDLQSNDTISSNQVKSDLSNTRLRQQEMEIRYLTAAARLESANQYIFLLRMKEQVAVAQLMVEQKKGFEARKALGEIKTLYDHLYPYVIKKDPAAAKELESLIQVSIQDLTSDPDSASTDLADIELNLEKVEAALFQME